MPKRVYQPKKLKRLRKHGFRSRMQSIKSKNVISTRRSKKRTTLSVSDEVRVDKNKRLSRRK